MKFHAVILWTLMDFFLFTTNNFATIIIVYFYEYANICDRCSLFMRVVTFNDFYRVFSGMIGSSVHVNTLFYNLCSICI